MQIETHPFNQQNQLVKMMQDNNIQAQAWSPLIEGRNNIFDNKTLSSIGKKYQKTVPQIILRWLIERNIAVVPKSIHENHLKQNLDVFDFSLSDKEMTEIAELNKDQSISPRLHDPDFIKTLSNF